MSRFNKGTSFFLCAIDIFSEYAWVVPLKDKKGITITNAFQKMLDESGRKTNKIWVDKGSEFYNRLMKSWLRDNNIEMYSTHNEGKSVVAERLIKTLKNKIYKPMTSIPKIVYIDKLDEIVNKYNNTYRNTMLKTIRILILIKLVTKNILNLKLVIMLQYRNTKIFLLKDTLQIVLKKFL